MVARPELDPAEDAGGVVDDGRPFEQLAEVVADDAAGVAATEVQMVEKEKLVELGRGLADPAVPPVVADLFARPLAELVVVRLAFAERLVGELEVRQKVTVEEDAPCRSRCRG